MKVRTNTKKLSKLSFEQSWRIFTRLDGKKIMWNRKGDFCHTIKRFTHIPDRWFLTNKEN